MKKHLIFVAFCTAVALVSCTEKIPLNTAGSGQVWFDTTYVANVESQEPRNVLAEEATGVQCPNCPDGAMRLKEIEDKYPGRLIAIGLHAGKLTDPLEESKYNFQTNFAANLFSSYFGEPEAKPAACFDRTKQDNVYLSIFRLKWSVFADERMSKPASLNLTITSTYDAESNDYIITVKGAYTVPTNKTQNLSIMITEDNIIDAQEDQKGNIMTDYVHMHVLRDMVTATTGDQILKDISEIKAGRVFIKSFRYKVPEGKDWNVDNLNIVAFVHNNESGDREVQQAEEIKLKQE